MFAPAEAVAFRKFPEKSVKRGACVQNAIRATAKSSVILWVARSIVIHQGALHRRMGTKDPVPPAIQVSFATAQAGVGR